MDINCVGILDLKNFLLQVVGIRVGAAIDIPKNDLFLKFDWLIIVDAFDS